MALRTCLKSYSPDGILEGFGLKALLAFFSAKAVRGGPRLLPQLAICVVVLFVLTRLMPTHLSDVAFGTNYTTILKWKPKGGDDGSVGGGLRIVVFGGGDIATPNKTPEKAVGHDVSWTEVLCQHLDCTTHLSYMPRTDIHGGSLVSNSLYEAILERMANETEASEQPGLDYTWLPREYPVPTELPDLQQQLDAFFATPPPMRPAQETLWVFNFGYWDIWRLACLPPQLAMDAIEVQARHIFAQIEVLYQESRSEKSIAYSDFYTFLNSTTKTTSSKSDDVIADVPIEPFRVFIPRLFDITLTPGFDKARFVLPYPHSRAVELRNAVHLTEEWNLKIDKMFDEWLAMPDPEVATTDDTLGKREGEAPINVPYARREAISTYDVSDYMRNAIIERQMQNAHVEDKTGRGTRPAEEGFLEVQQPCLQLVHDNVTDVTKTVVCDAPQEYLFWTEFTVSQRAIDAMGKQAAAVFTKHAQTGSQWLKKSTDLFPGIFNSKRAVGFNG
ncbi:uncharacterized protein BCR38DRAFT_343419 [Pseudomassariella vexata]|uniref:Uncharacterized protein n=1 Tax=Pseudomassariella vexata TaxID=1141098 RepID=A0A1Y2DZ73_9PEZI|nr:uncharacterized protein BCR38DRAFT_343419 [Pseudomassariella vexata]ORY63935.1 hypothetical protein BCR38DRAFT_343419 [Pseudomassariella vexata]